MKLFSNSEILYSVSNHNLLTFKLGAHMMKLYTQKIGLAVAVFSLAMFFTNCSDDNGVSTPEECTTSLPNQLLPASIQTDYFSSQNIPEEDQYSTYKEVEAVALGRKDTFGTSGPFGLGISFLNVMRISGIQPDMDGNSCVWEAPVPSAFVPQGDITVTVRATPASDRVNWEVIIDGTFGGESLDNFAAIKGFTSNDEMNGEWELYDLENPGSSANPVAEYAWDIRSENDYDLTLDSEYTSSFSSISYTRKDAENDLITHTGDTTLQVFWDEENDLGWIEDENGKRCYEDFINADC